MRNNEAPLVSCPSFSQYWSAIDLVSQFVSCYSDKTHHVTTVHDLEDLLFTVSCRIEQRTISDCFQPF